MGGLGVWPGRVPTQTAHRNSTTDGRVTKESFLISKEPKETNIFIKENADRVSAKNYLSNCKVPLRCGRISHPRGLAQKLRGDTTLTFRQREQQFWQEWILWQTMP